MPSAELVGYSNLALYSAMAIFTVSMLVFAAYLAALGPVAAERGIDAPVAAAGRRWRGGDTGAAGADGAGRRRRGVVGRTVAPGPQDRQHRALRSPGSARCCSSRRW